MRTLGLHPKTRRWLGRLILLAGSTGVALLLLEVAVRVLLPSYHPRAQLEFQLLTNGAWIGPANTTVRLANSKDDFDVPVTFNPLGLVDRKDVQAARAGAFYALGDSFTMGWGVREEERFSNLLEQRLAEPVYNVAIPNDLRGYRQLLAFAEEHGPRVSRLVLGVCMDNDLRDYREVAPARAVIPGSARPIFSLPRARRWFRAHSALFIAATHNLQKSSSSAGRLRPWAWPRTANCQPSGTCSTKECWRPVVTRCCKLPGTAR